MLVNAMNVSTLPMVVFFSNREQLHFLRDTFSPSECQYIALTPQADHAAQALNIQYRTIEDVYSLTELQERLENNFDELEQLCHTIDTQLNYTSEEYPTSWAKNYFYAIKILNDSATFYRTVIEKALEGASTVVYFAPPSTPLDPLDLNALKKVDWYAAAISMIAKRSQLQEITYLSGRPAKHQTTRKQYARDFSVNMLRWVRSKIFASPSQIACETELHYQYRTLFIKPVFYDTKLFWYPFHLLTFFEKRFRSRYDIQDILMNPSNVIQSAVRRKYHAFDRVNPLFKCFLSNKTLLLMRIPTEDYTCFMAAYAKKNKISITIPQHGGFVGYVKFPLWNYLEGFFADTVWMLAPGCKRAYVSRNTHLIENTDIKSIYQIRKKTPVASQKILVVTDGFYDKLVYFAGSYALPIHMARLQKTTIELLCNVQPGDIHFKGYPSQKSFNPIHEQLKEAAFRTRVIDRTSASLTEVLKNEHFDMVYLMAPATCLLQCLATSMQIVFYCEAKYYHLHEDSKAMLKKRVHLAEDEATFLHYVQQGMAISHKPIDDDFLHAYGLPLPHEVTPPREVLIS